MDSSNDGRFQKIRWQATLAVMAVLALTCLIFFLFQRDNARDALNALINAKEESARLLTETIVQQARDRYTARIRSFTNIQTAQQWRPVFAAFAARDREELQRLCLPLFHTLKKESTAFTSIGWVLPDNHVFLRVQNPDLHGDYVGDLRTDVATINENRPETPISGFEIGPYGLQFRIAQAVFFDDQYLGVVQFGIDNQLISGLIEEKLHLPTALIARRDVADKSPLSPHPKAVFGDYALMAPDLALYQNCAGRLDFGLDRQEALLKGRHYVLTTSSNLRDSLGRNVAKLIIALDVSEDLARTYRLNMTAAALVAVVLLCGYAILHLSFGALTRKIVGLDAALRQSNRELEQRVRERTRDLEQANGELQAEIAERQRVHAQRNELETKLRQSEKMEAIGLMAGGVAHDLNNILSGIIGYPDLLLRKLPLDSDLRRLVEAIRQSGERASGVVADLLTVAQGAAAVKSITSLNELVRNCMASPECKTILAAHPRITWRQELGSGLDEIECSPVHVRKCLMNLLQNSSESIKEQGTITISTRQALLDSPLDGRLRTGAGGYSVLQVADDGTGIAAADLEHIFEPFYTRKVMGRGGTGLGLTVVWNTLREHRGGITLESSEAGTVFALYFPSAPGRATKAGKATGEHEPQGHGEKILVVDDEPMQRDLASQLLGTLNYQVSTAASGETALAFLADAKVDLVLLDMLMPPGINGCETYARIVLRHPGQKALIVSGFAEDQHVTMALDKGPCKFLKKPYSFQQLGMMVHDILTN